MNEDVIKNIKLAKQYIEQGTVSDSSVDAHRLIVAIDRFITSDKNCDTDYILHIIDKYKSNSLNLRENSLIMERHDFINANYSTYRVLLEIFKVEFILIKYNKNLKCYKHIPRGYSIPGIGDIYTTVGNKDDVFGEGVYVREYFDFNEPPKATDSHPTVIIMEGVVDYYECAFTRNYDDANAEIDAGELLISPHTPIKVIGILGKTENNSEIGCLECKPIYNSDEEILSVHEPEHVRYCEKCGQHYIYNASDKFYRKIPVYADGPVVQSLISQGLCFSIK